MNRWTGYAILILFNLAFWFVLYKAVTTSYTLIMDMLS